MGKTRGMVEFDGLVTQSLPNTMFKVDLGEGRVILATLTGRLRKSFVRIFPGDRVRVEVTPYDEERGRIVYKY